MYKIEINPTICRIFKLFYQFGIWPKEEESNFRKMCRKLFYLFNHILYQVFLVTCSYLSPDQNECIFLLAVDISVAVVTVKLIYVLWKSEESFEFLYVRIVDVSVGDREEFELFNKKLNKFVKFVHVYLLMICVTFIFVMSSCLPIFSGEKQLPLFIDFTLDWEYSEIIYWITYAFMGSQMACTVLFNLIILLIWYAMLTYSIEYQALVNQFRNLGMNGMNIRTKKVLKKNLKSETRNLYLQELIGLIKAHRNIFEYDIIKFQNCTSIIKEFSITGR